MRRHIEKLARVRLKSGVGVFESDGVVYRVELAFTPLGAVRAADAGPDVLALLRDTSRVIVERLRACVPARFVARLPWLRGTEASANVEREPGARARKHAVPMRVGIRPSAVTLHSEVFEETQQTAASAAAEAREERSGKQERRAAKVLEDTIVLSAGKKKVRLTAKARVEEVQSIVASTGLDPMNGYCYEPAPWALWRASTHHAALKRTTGVHLRFVLGEKGGVAVLAAAKAPLAWHVVSWTDAERRGEALIQAYHLLRVHALRRLRFDEIAGVSVQGDACDEESRASLETSIGVPVEQVPGPAFDAELVTFGLALGALENARDTLNLARSLQPAPSIMQLVPWGEAAFLFSLFVSMYLTLHFHVAGLRQEARVATQQADAVEWARGVNPTKLKQEIDSLNREVDPLATFLTRELSFGLAFSSVAKQLPPKAWLVGVSAEDHVWEKNPNKALGQRYLLLTAGAPSAREGLAPPEINLSVHGVDDDPYIEKVLPRVKLADVNWHQEGGHGYALFSLLALPKEAAK